MAVATFEVGEFKDTPAVFAGGQLVHRTDTHERAEEQAKDLNARVQSRMGRGSRRAPAAPREENA